MAKAMKTRLLAIHGHLRLYGERRLLGRDAVGKADGLPATDLTHQQCTVRTGTEFVAKFIALGPRR
jgi:hypothetical protein